ncbi:MAG: hypothetical protein KME16_11665 [Scytolyngbya sp. HA4215-MV1]|nr:hypothetical protein [Scytolyngbya sp. HA4215-MV1]
MGKTHLHVFSKVEGVWLLPLQQQVSFNLAGVIVLDIPPQCLLGNGLPSFY